MGVSLSPTPPIWHIMPDETNTYKSPLPVALSSSSPFYPRLFYLAALFSVLLPSSSPSDVSVFFPLQRCIWRSRPAVWIHAGRSCCPSCCPLCWPSKLWVGAASAHALPLDPRQPRWEVPLPVKQYALQGLLVFPPSKASLGKTTVQMRLLPKNNVPGVINSLCLNSHPSRPVDQDHTDILPEVVKRHFSPLFL